MRHERVTDEIREQAALHALGMLEPDEARAFQSHMEGGCAVCESELRAFEATASRVPVAFEQERPPRSVRERLFAWVRSAPEPQPEPPLHIVRSEHGAWQDTGVPGVSVKQLYADPAQDKNTMLVRMAPGATYPGHRHAGTEQCYVLEGDLRFGDLVFHAGDYQCAIAESTHQVSSTEHGCLLLIIASPHDQILA